MQGQCNTWTNTLSLFKRETKTAPSLNKVPVGISITDYATLLSYIKDPHFAVDWPQEFSDFWSNARKLQFPSRYYLVLEKSFVDVEWLQLPSLDHLFTHRSPIKTNLKTLDSAATLNMSFREAEEPRVNQEPKQVPVLPSLKMKKEELPERLTLPPLQTQISKAETAWSVSNYSSRKSSNPSVSSNSCAT